MQRTILRAFTEQMKAAVFLTADCVLCESFEEFVIK